MGIVRGLFSIGYGSVWAIVGISMCDFWHIAGHQLSVLSIGIVVKPWTNAALRRLKCQLSSLPETHGLELHTAN